MCRIQGCNVEMYGDVLVTVGKVCEEEKLFVEGVQLLEAAGLGPQAATTERVQSLLGCYCGCQMTDEAIVCATWLLQRDENNVEIRIALAHLLRQAGRAQEALDVINPSLMKMKLTQNKIGENELLKIKNQNVTDKQTMKQAELEQQAALEMLALKME
ncbi:MAG: hypothetical protein EZS28_020971 [Streblomastix strix]|uniref:Uncharacterized protein n=1 Tax=Streblomastix strix TaxID=222440 RepID=A0A5J4VM16_9EUKA|nr:MAG: hypothetical protein EZS28_020971 [Streblomastix strix]